MNDAALAVSLNVASMPCRREAAAESIMDLVVPVDCARFNVVAEARADVAAILAPITEAPRLAAPEQRVDVEVNIYEAAPAARATGSRRRSTTRVTPPAARPVDPCVEARATVARVCPAPAVK